MPKKRKKLSQRTDVLSILIALMISSTLSFVIPLVGIIYLDDIFVVIGMICGSYFIVKREVTFNGMVKNLLILTFIGGIIIGTDLTSITILIYYSEGLAFKYPITYLVLLTGYIIITQLIIALLIIGFYYLKGKEYFEASSE